MLAAMVGCEGDIQVDAAIRQPEIARQSNDGPSFHSNKHFEDLELFGKINTAYTYQLVPSGQQCLLASPDNVAHSDVLHHEDKVRYLCIAIAKMEFSARQECDKPRSYIISQKDLSMPRLNAWRVIYGPR